MEYFESLALESSQLQSKLWLRNVDDTFVIWQHGEESLHSFLNHLNGLWGVYHIHYGDKKHPQCSYCLS